MSEATGKILVIRGGAIGDFILTLPALAALRAQFPNARLEVLGYPHIIDLARAGGLVVRAQSIEARALAGFFARDGTLDEKMAAYFSSFAVILSYLYDPDAFFQSNVGRCSRAQFICGPHRPCETENVHAADVFLRPLERLAIFDADAAPKLDLIPPEVSTQHTSADEPMIQIDLANRWLAVHPGSGSERKNWPEQNWAKLLQALTEGTALKFLLVGGEAEGERLTRLAAVLPPSRTRRAQSLPLVQLAHELKRCAAFIGHDSGITHLASALGLSGVVLWGDSNLNIWRPRSSRMVIIEAVPTLSALPVAQVLETVARIFSKG